MAATTAFRFSSKCSSELAFGLSFHPNRAALSLAQISI